MTPQQKFNATVLWGFAIGMAIAVFIAVCECIALLTLKHI